MPITLNHSNINVQYSSDKSYIIETVKSDLYRRNENVDTVIRNNIQTAPITPTTYVDSSGNVYAVESYTYSGTADTADYTRVFPKNTTCDILVVGGGGGGGGSIGGGGGGGSVIYSTNITIPTGSYNILIGKGGSGGVNETDGAKGTDSTAFGATAFGGGRGGDYNVSNSETSGGSGGGEGGGANNNQAGVGVAGLKGTNTIPNTSLLFTNYQYYVNDGGLAFYQSTATNLNATRGGGGGGAGTAGGAGGGNAIDTTTQGLGGDGIPISISGNVVYYGAGGGGGAHKGSNSQNLGKSGGLGGGGNGGNEFSNGTKTNGTDGTGFGAGGGGGSYSMNGGNGGYGIVIIRYLLGSIATTNFLTNEPVITAPTFTESIRTFVHSGGTEAQTTYNITVPQNTICDILIVGGGGGGGNGDGSSNEPGGGGAGGVVYMINKTFTAGTYKINVGKGGASNTNGNNSTITDNNNNTITFDSILLIGKGGGKGATTSSQSGSDGGSGGGGTHPRTNGGLATQGNTFWNGTTYVAGGYNGAKPAADSRGGGGGGAGEAGDTDGIGFGGDGVQVNISGTNTFYAGGGNAFPNRTTTRSDGGGGLVPATGYNVNGGDALENTGSGGSGAYGGSGSGGKGGSGIVIIKFKSNTNAAFSEGTPVTTHKRLNFAYAPNYPFIQADTTNLKAWYKFDDNFDDSSGNGANLVTNTGTPTLSTTQYKIGKSSFLSNATLRTTGFTFHNKAFAIACWVYQTESGVILSQIKAATTNQTLLIGLNPAGDYFFVFYYNDFFSPTVYSGDINNWVHLVFQIDTNRNREIWRNGVRIANDTSASFLNTDNNQVIIGRYDATGDAFGGYIDDMRFYDKALTSAEISQLYNIPTINQYTLNFPVPTLTDINNNSNIVLNGAYDISLNTSNALIIPKNNQYIPNPITILKDSEERMYPPVRNFTADTTTISGQTYGNGTYIVTGSSFISSESLFNLFNGTNVGWTQSTPEYDGTPAGTYTGGFSFEGFPGEWIKIQLPVSIKLTKYIIETSSIGGVNRAPSIYKIFGSNDNTIWKEIVYKSIALVSGNYISNKFEEIVYSDNYYKYFVLVISKNIGLDGFLSIGEWSIYGKEQVSNLLSIRYSLLNPILDPIGAQWTYSSNNTNVYHIGSVGIGTTSPEYQLDVRGNIYSSSGGYTQSGLTTWSITSDRRIKDNIVKASYEKCLENVKNIELYNFTFKNNYVNTNDRHQLGFIAQEVQQVYPKAVEVGKMMLNANETIDNVLTLNTTQIDYTLYGAVKNIIEKIDNIDNELSNIETLI